MTEDSPYTTPKSTDCDSCRCSAAFGAYEFCVFLLVAVFSIYGLCRLMDDTGITVWYEDGSSHFWFEEDLRGWIHGR